jgi:two-component system, cell cycle sensor histidine kinase and response regulator CckA
MVRTVHGCRTMRTNSGGWRQWRRTAAGIAAAYLVLGLLWILLSDRALGALVGDPADVARYQTVKGWLYVIVSAAALYALIARQMRRVLRQSALLDHVVEGTSDAIFLKDRDGRYVMLNDAAARIIGMPASEVVGRSDAELFPADVARRLAERDRLVIESGEPRTFEEEVAVAGGGRRVFLVAKSPHRDPRTGHVVGVIGVGQEITGRAESERELRESERRYRQLVEASRASEERFRVLIERASDPIAILDAEGTLLYGSPAFSGVLGYEPGEVVGTNAFDLVHPDDAGGVREAWGRLLSSPGESVAADLHLRRRDGSWCVLSTVSRNLLDHPAVEGVVINGRDITAQHTLAEQLRQAQKMEAVGRLAGGVAHDFNNLLTAILANAEFALTEIPASSPARADIDEVIGAAKRAAGLTRQLLAFSRKQVMQPQLLELNAVVQDTERLLRRVIPENVEIVVHLAPSLPPVRADRTQIEQVLLNLVTNARDAMPGGGAVTIATSVQRLDEGAAARRRGLLPGEYVQLSVRDTGMGMDDVTRSRLFEPFFTTKDLGRGTGLGLATVYGVVKQSGGYIYVDTGPGRGTTFTMLLPAVVESAAASGGGAMPNGNGQGAAAASSAAAAGGGHGGGGSRGETLLLVEDDAAVRIAARRTLEAHGYTVLDAADAEQALALWSGRHGAVDVLLTDLVMPGLDGRALADRLRADRPGLRVIFMSGYASGFIDSDSLRAPGTELIDKPFAADALVGKVREVLKG